eukprot:7050996-Pyramimonas_sp.AAC.1
MVSVHASLVRTIPLCRRSCSQYIVRLTPSGIFPSGTCRRNWAPGRSAGTQNICAMALAAVSAG